MKRILYIGNYLRGKGSNPSYMFDLGRKLEIEGFNLKYTSSKNNRFLRLLDMISSVIKYRNETGLILIDTYSTLNFYYALFCSQFARHLKKDYICILHGGNLPKRLEKNPFLSDLIFNNSYANVAPSEYLNNAFNNHGYKRLHYIPNTINIENYPFAKKEFNMIKLLWVRSFSKIYNPKMALLVLDRLLKKGYQAELCMVGPDSDGSLGETKKLALEMDFRVKFTGKLEKHEWISLSREYNILINTTNFDNTPVSVIEAMALGLPIVSTNVGGMPYLVEHEIHGLLVNPNSPVEMANAIIRLFENQELRECVINNARLRAEQFDWEEVKVQWNAILQKNNS